MTAPVSDRRSTENLIRQLEGQVRDIKEDASVKIKSLEKDVASLKEQGVSKVMDGTKWIKWMFSVVLVKGVMLIIVLMWMSALDSRINIIKDEVAKINPAAQAAAIQTTERFVRIETELRSLRNDFDSFQKRVTAK